jgi:hypothetical protein
MNDLNVFKYGLQMNNFRHPPQDRLVQCLVYLLMLYLNEQSLTKKGFYTQCQETATLLAKNKSALT